LAPGRWVIVLNADDVYVRQRFTMAHEFKHVLDSEAQAIMFARVREPELVRERVADHFAACLLMPKVWVVRAWAGGIQGIVPLARMFEVSRVAMNWRLQELGLIGPIARCAGVPPATQQCA
jgi:Zn-dependent peptidase ImmA (M78 family)